MKNIISALVLGTVCLVATTAVSDTWHHAVAPMGQFEGGYQSEDGEVRIHYGCDGFSSRIEMTVAGMQVAAGVSRIHVDAAEVASGDTIYHSLRDETVFSSDVRSEWGQQMKDPHNRLIAALARGASAIWTTPNGRELRINLQGSQAMRNCLVN
jgi:hypothetical protein